MANVRCSLMPVMLALLAVAMGILATVAAARESANDFDGCETNWVKRLEGRSVVGVNVYDQGRIWAYLVDETRVLWIQDGLPYVQDDSWSIRDCNTLCWELDRFDDLCSTLVATPYGVDLYDPDYGDRLFQWTLGEHGDQHDLLGKKQNQRFNPLAHISNWLL